MYPNTLSIHLTIGHFDVDLTLEINPEVMEIWDKKLVDLQKLEKQEQLILLCQIN